MSEILGYSVQWSEEGHLKNYVTCQKARAEKKYDQVVEVDQGARLIEDHGSPDYAGKILLGPDWMDS